MDTAASGKLLVSWRPASLALFESFASHVQNPFDLMIYAAVGTAELRRRLASTRSHLAHVWRAHERGERKPYSAEEETLLVEREAIMDLTLQARSASGPQCCHHHHSRRVYSVYVI